MVKSQVPSLSARDVAARVVFLSAIYLLVGLVAQLYACGFISEPHSSINQGNKDRNLIKFLGDFEGLIVAFLVIIRLVIKDYLDYRDDFNLENLNILVEWVQKLDTFPKTGSSAVYILYILLSSITLIYLTISTCLQLATSAFPSILRVAYLIWGWSDVCFAWRSESKKAKVSVNNSAQGSPVSGSAQAVESVGEFTSDSNSSSNSSSNSNFVGKAKTGKDVVSVANSIDSKCFDHIWIRAIYATLSAHIPALAPALYTRRLFPVVDSIVVLLASAMTMILLSFLAAFLAKRANLVSAAHQQLKSDKFNKDMQQMSFLRKQLWKLLTNDNPLSHFSKSPTVSSLFKLIFSVLVLQSLFLICSHRTIAQLMLIMYSLFSSYYVLWLVHYHTGPDEWKQK